MRRTGLSAVALAACMWGSFAHASLTMAPLTTFGNNGWLAPNGTNGSTYTYLDTGNNERGLAFGNGHVYLVSRVGGSNIRMLDPTTGADLGGLSTTGITGGTFAVNAIGVGGDGAIYVGNLTSASNTGSGAFKVYSWANEASTPTTFYSGTAGISGIRAGDDLAVTGSGSGTEVATGYASSPSVSGNNGYAIINSSGATAVGFSGNPPAAGDFRLGLTFLDASDVLGSQGNSLYRDTSFSGSTGTLNGSPNFPDPSGATADRLMAYANVDGANLLAVQSTGDSHVTLYNVDNPAAPVYLASGLNIPNTITPAANGNSTGDLAWNVTPGSPTATLYAMSTNQGIQAFSITIPEPASLSVVALTGLVGIRRRTE